VLSPCLIVLRKALSLNAQPQALTFGKKTGEITWSRPSIHDNSRGQNVGRWKHASSALLSNDQRAVFIFGGERASGSGQTSSGSSSSQTSLSCSPTCDTENTCVCPRLYVRVRADVRTCLPACANSHGHQHSTTAKFWTQLEA
jgi:hypothetical protein